MKITKVGRGNTFDFVVETGSKTRYYAKKNWDSDAERAEFVALLEAEFAKNPDFEPDDVWSDHLAPMLKDYRIAAEASRHDDTWEELRKTAFDAGLPAYEALDVIKKYLAGDEIA